MCCSSSAENPTTPTSSKPSAPWATRCASISAATVPRRCSSSSVAVGRTSSAAWARWPKPATTSACPIASSVSTARSPRWSTTPRTWTPGCAPAVAPPSPQNSASSRRPDKTTKPKQQSRVREDQMFKKGIEGFPYYLGVASLADLATRADRVAVLNILGGESRQVTPVSHAFSGGNVVFGTSPGRRGQVLPTPIGDIPVYNNVREGLDAGLSFNTGVVYLPPSGVRDGVAELVRVNPNLEKIVMITEKISVHDAREIRALGQANGIDIFGANCLGVADSWNRVRIGGALGGDNPEEVLLKGSVAIFSNSGGFTTTIAQYLATEGWGTTTLISSGKDVYIHYAARDFAHAFNNDLRSKAAVLYAEPGGYYERGVEFHKPVVACI